MKLITIFSLLLLCAGSIAAQSTATITVLSQRTGDPDAGMGLRVRCNLSPSYDVEAGNIAITDNGKNAGSVTVLSGASPLRRDPFSALLALDVNDEMGGTTFDYMREASHAFVQFLDSTSDEAAILSFGNGVRLQQPMSIARLDLHNAIDALAIGGSTSIYEALLESVEHAGTASTTDMRAVIAITSGGDHPGGVPPEDVIFLAQQRNVRIFFIGIGNVVNQNVLQQIARSTGGEYYTEAVAANLESRLMEIAALARRGFDEYRLSFSSPDPGAKTHSIVVQCTACGTVLTDTRTEAVDDLTGIGDAPMAAASFLVLGQNTPNPVAAGVTADIPFSVTSSGAPRLVTLSVYDMLGRRVADLVKRELSAGDYHAKFSTGDLPSGLYLYRLGSGNETRVRKLIIQR